MPLTDYAGTLGPDAANAVGGNAGSYRWKMFARLNYSVGPANIGLQWQHKPAAKSVQSATDTATTVAGAPAYNLFNLNFRYDVMENVAIRGGIDNLFNVSPPYVGYFMDDVPGDARTRFNQAANPYLPSQYDVLGRRFYLGVNFKL